MKINKLIVVATAATLVIVFPPYRYFVVCKLIYNKVLNDTTGTYRVVRKGGALR